MSAEHAWQRCLNPQCAATLAIDQVLVKCPQCGELLDVEYDWDKLPLPNSLAEIANNQPPAEGLCRLSGVWRFGALLPFAPAKYQASIGEGHTQLRPAGESVKQYTGVADLWLQYEGLNPSGSFKDNGMAGAFTHAQLVGAKTVAAASTGNTSASMAAFAAALGNMRAVIFIGDGKIAYGKLSQALDYGAKTLLLKGDFDDAMQRVQEVCAKENIYLVNSLNPFRLEGQKTTMYRVLEGLNWRIPDWVVVPGGNLGNSAAFGKAFIELRQLGLIDKVPRLAVINAQGAPTLANLVNQHGLRWRNGAVDEKIINDYYAKLDQRREKAQTLASAIEINRPVNLKKCLRALEFTGGVVRAVSDQEIVDAKAQIARAGLGCEPASAASVAGLKALVNEGVIDQAATVAGVLTGHQLKDPHLTVAYHSHSEAALAKTYETYGLQTAPYANRPISVANNLEDIIAALK